MHATPDAKQPIAIIIPHEAHLRQALDDTKAKVDLHELCKDEGVRKMVLKGCNDLGKKNGFKGLEMLQAVVLTPDEWTPESGLVTAAQKVQRKKVGERFGEEIKVCVCYCFFLGGGGGGFCLVGRDGLVGLMLRLMRNFFFFLL